MNIGEGKEEEGKWSREGRHQGPAGSTGGESGGLGETGRKLRVVEGLPRAQGGGGKGKEHRGRCASA